MVNKALVGVIGVILIATLGVGAIVGLMGGGGPADDGPDTNGNGNGPAGTATGTPNGSMTDASPVNGTATPGDEPQRDISLSRTEFTRAEIEENLSAGLNDWRGENGAGPLRTSGTTTADSLRAMARGHSDAMAEVEEVTQEIDNSTIQSRYRAAGMYDRCSYIPPDKSYVTHPGSPDVEKFEWVAGTEVETTFTRDEGIRFHENESAVASRLLEQWRGHEALGDGLLSDHYEPAGVGVNVSSDGTVYATVALCGP